MAVQPILNSKSFSDIINCLIEKFKGILSFLGAARYSKYLDATLFGRSF